MYLFIEIAESEELINQAAEILTSTFKALDKDSWPDFYSAKKEVIECIQDPNICIGICNNNKLLGWIGLRPMYEKTWELHPLVVKQESQQKGIGRLLITELEKIAKNKKIIGIALGTDDETGKTSLSAVDLDETNLFKEIMEIKNIKNHPFEFYKKCGYIIVGIIPNANGIRRPDIWMWKSLI